MAPTTAQELEVIQEHEDICTVNQFQVTEPRKKLRLHQDNPRPQTARGSPVRFEQNHSHQIMLFTLLRVAMEAGLFQKAQLCGVSGAQVHVDLVEGHLLKADARGFVHYRRTEPGTRGEWLANTDPQFGAAMLPVDIPKTWVTGVSRPHIHQIAHSIVDRVRGGVRFS